MPVVWDLCYTLNGMRLKLWTVISSCILLWGMVALCEHEITPAKRFDKAKNLFQFQDYKKAARQLKLLLYPTPIIKDKARLLKAREYLGACYFWMHKDKQMEEEFTALLVKDPTYKLDPFYYPVPLLESFNKLRTRLQSQGVIPTPQKDKKKAGKTPIIKKKGPAMCRTVKKLVIKHNKVLCFIPFGVGQFVNGRPKKAAGFLSTQVIGLGVNIGAFIAIETLRGDDGMFSSSNASKARIMRYVQYAGLGVFVVSAVWGILDALHDFKEQETKTRVIVTPCPTGAAVGVSF